MLSFFKTPPRIPEIVFAAVLIWMFAAGQGWSVMLADGDTGWHIRNGERILDSGTVPHLDPFAFGSGAHPWFAWEWLSDVLFAALFRHGGLKAVAWFCGIAIAASVSLLLRHLLWRSVGVHIAFPLALLTAGASSIHYLARPHVLGLSLFAAVAWIIDRDRREPSPWVWSLPAIIWLWSNLHGSFLAGLAMLGLRFVETVAIERSRSPRAAMLLAASGVATLLNPYGWQLHAHAIEYLRSGWIQASVEEFQSPRFRSQNMFFYELLLLTGVAAMPWLLRRKEIYPCLAILLWAHESLASVRHVPLYCLAASPFIGSWLQSRWSHWIKRLPAHSLPRTVEAINLTWRPWCDGYTVWPLLLAAWLALPGARADFPAAKFPVALVQRNTRRLSAGSPRVFSSDQWSDYLIFQLYPSVRVYFDGRSDFFGPWRGEAYLDLLRGQSDSPAILDREGVEWALLPKDWALTGLLRRSPEWRVEDADEQGILFARDFPKSASAPNQKAATGR